MRSPYSVSRGFTLIELLVVTGLIATMFALLIVGMRSGGNNAAQVRRSAQLLASAIIAAQSRALGQSEGAGVVIDPLGSLGTEVDEALMHPFITGNVTTGMPPVDLTATSAAISFTPDNASPADLVHGYRIQLFGNASPTQPPTAWLGFTNPTSSGGTVRFRQAAGQTIANTIWPKPAGTGMAARIARYPDKAGAQTALEKAAAIDMRWSGVGDDRTTPYGRFDGKGAIAVTFDRTGAVSEVMQQVLAAVARTVDPDVPRQPIYFLVALRSDINNSTVNVLSRQEAVWVTLSPLTGRVAVSSNVPQAGTDTAALTAARANARLGIPIGK